MTHDIALDQEGLGHAENPLAERVPAVDRVTLRQFEQMLHLTAGRAIRVDESTVRGDEGMTRTDGTELSDFYKNRLAQHWRDLEEQERQTAII